MSTSYTLAFAGFPNGTTVHANPARAQAEPVSAVMTDGEAVFGGLFEFEEYTAHATVDGRYVAARFRTDGGPDAPTPEFDVRYAPQAPSFVYSICAALNLTGTLTPVINQLRVARLIVPSGGLLRDVSLPVMTASGNLIAVVYDTGDALAGSRTLLWSSGSVACPAASPPWRIVGDPQIEVYQGQQLDVGWIFDNITARPVGCNGTANHLTLPASYLVAAGALPKLNASFTLAGFEAPATVAEADLAVAAGTPLMGCRVEP